MTTKRNVIGIQVDATHYDDAVERIMDCSKRKQGMSVTALAVHGVMTGVWDPEHRYRLNRFDLVCPDGQPVRWALNAIHRCGLKDRVYGPELTLRLTAAAAEQGIPIFLFGGDADLLDTLGQKLTEKFPDLKIAGVRPSLFRTMDEAERDELAAHINASGAGICFVGLGCPRQEVFAYEMRDLIHMPLIAVGAAYSFHAGKLAQAPPWMQSLGLEWLFRLSREPTRLFKRYATTNPAFAGLAIAQKLGLYQKPRQAELAPQQEVLYG